MPRKPWRLRPRGSAGLTEPIYEFFAHGAFFDGELYEQRTTPAQRDADWRECREQILARFSEENRQRGKWFAGRRPARFWTDLGAAGHVRREVGMREWWGPREPGGQKLRRTPILESDLEFLNRVAPIELQPWEREALEARHAQQAAPTKGAQVSM